MERDFGPAILNLRSSKFFWWAEKQLISQCKKHKKKK